MGTSACGPGADAETEHVVRPFKINRPPSPVISCSEASAQFESDFQKEVDEILEAIRKMREIKEKNSPADTDANIDPALQSHHARMCEFADRQIKTLEQRMAEIDSFKHALWNKNTLRRHGEIMRTAKARLGNPIDMKEIEQIDADLLEAARPSKGTKQDREAIYAPLDSAE